MLKGHSTDASSGVAFRCTITKRVSSSSKDDPTQGALFLSFAGNQLSQIPSKVSLFQPRTLEESSL